MYKSTITSKGQITVPKEIREHLKINTGDTVVFNKNEDNSITFERDNKVVDCPVCKGYGSFNINDIPCFVCEQTKFVSLDISIWEQIKLMKLLDYGVSISIITQEIGPNGELVIREIPKINLYSKRYFEQIITIAQDYYQMRFIEEYTPRSISNPEKYMNPTDKMLDEILDLLKSEEAKNEVRKWFRYERNTFTPTQN